MGVLHKMGPQKCLSLYGCHVKFLSLHNYICYCGGPVKRLRLTLLLACARCLVTLQRKKENANNDKILCSMYSSSCIMPGHKITMVSVTSAS